MELLKKLMKREQENNPIKVGLVGCGQMGSGMVHITNTMPGMKIKVIADIDINRPRSTLNAINVPPTSICITDKVNKAQDELRKGKFVITQDALLLPQLEDLDAIVEATGNTETGAQVAWNCILHSKHIIMLNVETDVTVGFFLHHKAQKSGCIYTVASGDEPGVCKNLYDFAKSLGFEVVCVGKGKNNPLDFFADPDSCEEEAKRENMNPKMLAAFQNGTKTMVEMAAVSNATGLIPDVPGMHGQKVDIDKLNKVLVPKKDGGILENTGCVDYSTGNVAPGVFLICTSYDERIRKDMKFLSMGDGPYYTLYRPYHLCNIETPISVAEAVLYKETTLVTIGMYAEVITVAKRDLKVGEIIGDIGSADVFHRIYTFKEAKALQGIPMGLATGGKMVKNVSKGELITSDSIALDTSRLVYKLRQMQDALVEDSTLKTAIKKQN